MRFVLLAAALSLASCARPAAETAVPVGPGRDAPPAAVAATARNPAIDGVVLSADRPIADDLSAAPTLSIFVRALAASDMAASLRASGPFTVFAPTNEAFGRLQPGTVDALLKPENRASPTRLLGLHVVAERLGAVELMRRVSAGGGRATLASVAGEPLTVTLTGGILTLTDAGGNRSYVETADVRQANGVVHVVNGVLVPKLN